MLAFREYVAEDVHEGRWRVVRRPPRGGGQAVPAAVAPDVEVQAVWGHPWAGVGVLLSPRGVDESQAGVPRAGGVEEVGQGIAPPGVVGGPLLMAAIMEVFIVRIGRGTPAPPSATDRRCRGRGGVARGAHATALRVAASGGTCRGVAAWRCAA